MEKDQDVDSRGDSVPTSVDGDLPRLSTGDVPTLLAEAVRLLHDIYDAHRDPQTYDTDWRYDANKKPLEDAPCAWCDDVKAVFDKYESSLTR